MSVLDWLGYRKRLHNVRGELVGIAEALKDIQDLQDLPKKVDEPLKKLARAVVLIAKILIRVIDTLPT